MEELDPKSIRDPIAYGYAMAAERARKTRAAEQERLAREARSPRRTTEHSTFEAAWELKPPPQPAKPKAAGAKPAELPKPAKAAQSQWTIKDDIAFFKKYWDDYVTELLSEISYCAEYLRREDVQKRLVHGFKALSFSIQATFWIALICDAWAFYNLNTGCHVQSLSSMGCLASTGAEKYGLFSNAPEFLRCHAANDCPDGFEWATDSTILPWKIPLPNFLTDSVFGYIGYALIFAWAIVVDLWFYFWYILTQPLAFNPPLIILLTGMLGGAVEAARYAYAANNPGQLPEIFDSPKLFDPLNRVGRENALGEARFATAAEASAALRGKVTNEAPPPIFED